VLKVMAPTLKSGELDLAVAIKGPTKGVYTLVGGFKVKDGNAIEQAAREVIKVLPESDRSKIKLDAATAGGVKIHQLDVRKDTDARTRRAFGDNPAFVAFRDDALFLAFGVDGLSALKEALAAKPQVAPQLRFEVDVARLAPAISNQEKLSKDAILKAASEAFGKGGTDSGRISVTVEGGQALKARLSAKLSVGEVFCAVSRTMRSEGE